MNIRKLLLTFHLWAGMTAAVFLLLLGVTGSLLVFEEEIDRVLNPKLTWVQPGAQRLPIAAMQAKLAAAYPGYRLLVLGISSRPDVAWNAALISQRAKGTIGVALNQYTGDILGTSADRNGFMGRVHQFHQRLLIGPVGGAIVAWAAVLLLGLSASGIVLWWPRKVFALRTNFTVHQTVGICCSVFLMIFALTAMVIHWEGAATSIANRLTGSEELPSFPRPQRVPPGTVPLDADRLLAIAQQTVPGARPTAIQLQGNPARIPMKYPEDRTPAGRTNLFLDRYTGKVLLLIDSRTAPLGFRIVKLWNREIHTGDIFGLPTRILACLISLMLPLLAVTGPLIWWTRRKT